MTSERLEPHASVRADRIEVGQFPNSPGSVARVRLGVAACLHDVPPLCRDAVVVIASELASNAVVHAATPYVVELLVTDVVRIEVADAGPSAPFVRLVSSGSRSGRGLFIVSKLSARWGVEWLEESKVVWAEVALDGQE
jgi:anti-sigma regulatory factor (Ser/Thr protein kinase)